MPKICYSTYQFLKCAQQYYTLGNIPKSLWCKDIHGNNNARFCVVADSGGWKGHVTGEGWAGGVCDCRPVFSLFGWGLSSWAGDEDMNRMALPQGDDLKLQTPTRLHSVLCGAQSVSCGETAKELSKENLPSHSALGAWMRVRRGRHVSGAQN